MSTARTGGGEEGYIRYTNVILSCTVCLFFQPNIAFRHVVEEKLQLPNNNRIVRCVKCWELKVGVKYLPHYSVWREGVEFNGRHICCDGGLKVMTCISRGSVAPKNTTHVRIDFCKALSGLYIRCW